MSKILLAQPVLPPGWTDLTVGEPHIIRDILLSEININKCHPVLSDSDFIYPSPCGYDKLVAFLEARHNAKVIITNGAKQGLGAAFYAVKQLGAGTIGLHQPYWALLPPLAELHDINIKFHQGNALQKAELIVSPNNPDGSIFDLDKYYLRCKANGSIMIHDAAYYTPIYTDQPLSSVGDVQIYSISKMLGLSSLRIGYVVCHNDDMYNHIQYYMEHMTVGVSKLPQMFLLNILKNLNIKNFEKKCFEALEENKKIVRNISPNIIELPKENQPGMFLWARVLNSKIFNDAKLHIINGEPFGNKDFIRINLAFKKDVMLEIVNRLNNAFYLNDSDEFEIE